MFKNILKEKHSGSTAVEWVILTPLMYMTFVILLYFFFMSLTYISYNNLSNSIAQELNMRQTGYSNAIAANPTMPSILTYKNGGTNRTLTASDIVVSPSTTELRCGTYFAMDKFKDQFVIPFSEVTSINVTSSKTILASSGKSLAGTIITVEIHYTSTVFGSNTFPSMKAIGYGVIS